MKSFIHIFFLIISYSIVYSQVGINTKTPTKTLDINGDMNLRKELRLGGSDNSLGDAGKLNQVLQVKDTEFANNVWKTYQVANGTGSLSLYYLNTTIDKKGLYFNSTGSTESYLLDSNSTNWNFLTDNKDSFVVKDATGSSKVTLNFQTTVQINRGSGSTGISASFACGVFMKKDNEQYKLKAVRSDVIRGVPGSYKIFNLNVTLDKLQQGSYDVQVACRNRQLGSGNTLVYIGIGQPVDATKLNQDMVNSTLTTTLLHPYS
ncbi:hypothetical protein ACTS94_00030 [Empedobacter falsenii]